MAELPTHPELLCFSEYINEFQTKDFHVDEFISKCRKQVTIECLRQDLDAYYRTLKNAMVELINKDYADFVTLSANLVGVDKSIDDLMTPLAQLQEEISNIKVCMESAIMATEDKLAQRTQIRKDKDTLHKLLDILESTEKLERLLRIKPVESSSGDWLSGNSKFAPMVMERIASEFNKLQYNVKMTNHPLVEKHIPRIATITSTLQSELEKTFKHGLESRDRRVLSRCLHTYASIDRCQAAEDLFRNLVVHPYMNELISSKSILNHTDGLTGLYADVMKFIPEHCSLLMDLTCDTGNRMEGDTIVKGFDFLVNSVWPEIVTLLDMKASVIFAVGNPDTFHKNYTSSMKFVSSFEEQCLSPFSFKALQSHPSYNTFMSKWSLPVYFQIRFQEIAGTLESCLSLPLASSTDDSSSYKLELFVTLEQCMKKCWSDEIFIPALLHRFWKLTLQLLIRVSLWLKETAATPISQVDGRKINPPERKEETLSLSIVLKIIHDCEQLQSKIVDVVLLPIKNKSQSQGNLVEVVTQIHNLVPEYATLIVNGVSQLCIQGLESASTLPRLYRRTNKDVPNKASVYVSNTLQPIHQLIGDFPSHHRTDWIERVISSVTKRYVEIVSELLTSVQRTEESLLKLKSYRKSLVPAASSSGGMSDDNKIRLQLALDIEAFTAQVLKFHPSIESIAVFKELSEMGCAAKTTALTI